MGQDKKTAHGEWTVYLAFILLPVGRAEIRAQA